MRNLVRASVLVVGVAAGGLLVGACGESVDRDGTIDQLMENGLTRAQAECFFDGAVDALGEDRLLEVEDVGQYTADERAVLEDIQLGCIESAPADADPDASPTEGTADE